MQQLINNFSIQIGMNAARALFVFVVLFILLIIPICIAIILPLFKDRLTPKLKVYLYAFITGFFIVMSLFGFMRDAIEKSSLFALQVDANNKNITYLYNVILVFGGALVGIIFSFVVKYVISYKLNKKLMSIKGNKINAFVHVHDHDQNNIHNHEHPDYIFNRDDTISVAEDAISEKIAGKFKVIALVLLLTHRIPEGFILGYLINQYINNENSSLTIAFMISLVLHLIPEEILFYYRLRDAGYSKSKSILISVSALCLFLPFMLMGAYFADAISNLDWLFAFLLAAIGGIFLFTSLVEFFPEFYHTHFDKKTWLKVIIILLCGVLFAIFILSFHSHH
ncbi:ZIP family metal transporter [Mycoplasmopsis ciconiae]|uniref:ZIP family metal transporter n=1 Tax=Mycoplasmopsis ciconiae TaxID=561067 RepID=A0ABU7MMK0_9BACT|nr:ZIP family metal transporter [Mycoplasmopsis ciconiae]